MAVTVLILSSVGENMLLAIKSLKRANMAPKRHAAGMMILGFSDLKIILAICGMAIPTKEMGPAKAVTVAERMLDTTIRVNLKRFISMPRVPA